MTKMPAFLWNPEVTLADVLTLVGFTLTFAGVMAAVRGIRRNQAVERGRFLMGIMDRLFRNEEVRKFWYRLDYNQWHFDANSFPLSDEERWLDYLLYQFDLVGRLVKLGLISEGEVKAIGFEAARVLTDNPEAGKYLDWLKDEYAGTRNLIPPHSDAMYLANLVKLHRSKPHS